jgi:UTP--glucose-1-phosphate uridylyltransferase
MKINHMDEIKKAVIPVAGLATRFLPLSKTVPKELWPLVDKPVIQYIIEEARTAGLKEIIFVVKPGEKTLFNYLEPSSKLEKTLKEKKKEKILEEVKKMEELLKDLSFTYCFQKQPLGDGHAILQAAKKIKDEPFACLFADDIVYSQTPCVSQLEKIFKTCQRPVMALSRIPKEKLSFYGIVSPEKIANRLYKIKKIVEKPEPNLAPSDLGVVGKSIQIPEVFDYLKKAKPSAKGEIILAEVLENMLKDGKLIYGYEFEGKWLECGNKLEWLKSNIFLGLKHPQYGQEIKKFIKENI